MKKTEASIYRQITTFFSEREHEEKINNTNTQENKTGEEAVMRRLCVMLSWGMGVVVVV